MKIDGSKIEDSPDLLILCREQADRIEQLESALIEERAKYNFAVWSRGCPYIGDEKERIAAARDELQLEGKI